MKTLIGPFMLFVSLLFIYSCEKSQSDFENEVGGHTTYSILHKQGTPYTVFECREYDRNGYEVVTHDIPVGERFLYADPASVRIKVYAIMTTKTGRVQELSCCEARLKKGKHVKCEIRDSDYRSILSWLDANYEY